MKVIIDVPDEKKARERLVDTLAQAGDDAHRAHDRSLADALHAIQKTIKRDTA